MDGVSNERMDKAWTFVGTIIDGEPGDFVIHRHGHGLHQQVEGDPLSPKLFILVPAISQELFTSKFKKKNAETRSL